MARLMDDPEFRERQTLEILRMGEPDADDASLADWYERQADSYDRMAATDEHEDGRWSAEVLADVARRHAASLRRRNRA